MKATLGYMMSIRPDLGTKQDPLSRNKNKNKMKKFCILSLLVSGAKEKEKKDTLCLFRTDQEFLERAPTCCRTKSSSFQPFPLLLHFPGSQLHSRQLQSSEDACSLLSHVFTPGNGLSHDSNGPSHLPASASAILSLRISAPFLQPTILLSINM